MTGRTISHYRIIEKLGEGAMGVVWKAEDIKLKRTVALKFLPPDALGNQELRARFLREAQAEAVLSHANVCTVFDVDEEAGFLALEYIEGETVQARINRHPLTLQEALDIALQATRGLAAVHARGVVHRDIKSSNLMVTPEGVVKIMDFGLARIAGQARMTRAGMVTGTLAYMSPEQVQGKPVDQRSDLWSMGAVLYEMVTGRIPFRGQTEAAVIYSILHAEPEPVTALRTGLPKQLDRIVAKLLAKDPELRYQRASDLYGTLKRLKRRTGPGLTTGELTANLRASPVRALPGNRLRRGFPIAIGAAVALAILLLALNAAGVRERLLGW